MKKIIFLFCLAFVNFAIAQDLKPTPITDIEINNNYVFKTIVDIEASEVKSQGRSGTCWSFSTSSFIESEIYRISGKTIDVSEMYTVRATYPKKAWNYVMRQGNAQFGEGGLGHDLMNAIKSEGLVPESEFSGLIGSATIHNHSQLSKDIKAVLDDYIKSNKNSNHPDWQTDIETILDEKLGKKIEEFVYEGVVYTPQSFLEMTGVNPNEYITLTSFTHIPYYDSFILNIPDNFANGRFYNIPLDEFNEIAQDVLNKGFSIEWDGDVSEATFSSKYGIAVIPNQENNSKKSLTEIVNELEVTADYRQQEYDNYNTTDDHLMHIMGLVTDQKGNIYYKVKNSWGTNSNRIGNDGYIYMSESFFKLKSISILVHKDALTTDLKKKFHI
ncbi:MAG: C1 family peptidase [Flavobacteriaceae bacterium]